MDLWNIINDDDDDDRQLAEKFPFYDILVF